MQDLMIFTVGKQKASGLWGHHACNYFSPVRMCGSERSWLTQRFKQYALIIVRRLLDYAPVLGWPWYQQ